jgi:hypothetical protein
MKRGLIVWDRKELKPGVKRWQRRQLEKDLREGYRATAKADQATARLHLAAGWEAIK